MWLCVPGPRAGDRTYSKYLDTKHLVQGIKCLQNHWAGQRNGSEVAADGPLVPLKLWSRGEGAAAAFHISCRDFWWLKDKSHSKLQSLAFQLLPVKEVSIGWESQPPVGEVEMNCCILCRGRCKLDHLSLSKSVNVSEPQFLHQQDNVIVLVKLLRTEYNA